VFYPRPEPGAPPFVEAGSRVEAGATVGLIEVMKVFNAVVSPVDGVIEAVLVGEQELVEYGQDLFAVRADA
jgi:acetyl-CoA carboxylase biotin carboxyl carrier protein